MTRFILVLTLLLATVPLAAEVSFEAKVNKLQTAFESPVRLELRVTVTDPNMVTKPLVPRKLDGFLIGGSGSGVSREGDTIIRTYTYDLKPMRSGSVTIPTLFLVYGDSLATDTLMSEPIPITVADPLALPTEGKTSIWVVIGCVVLAFGGGFWWYWRSRQGHSALEPNWRVVYEEQLDEARSLVGRQDYQGFSKVAAKLLMLLLERRFDRKLGGYTTTEIVKFLEEEGMISEQLERVSELLQYCDTVKYSTGEQDPDAGLRALGHLEKTVEPLLQ